MIEDLPHESIKNAIFRKGLVNILPEKVSNTLKNNVIEEQNIIKGIMMSDMVSESGSTKSDDLAKFNHKDKLIRLDSFELSSQKRFNLNSRYEEEVGEDSIRRSLRMKKDDKSHLGAALQNAMVKRDDVSGFSKGRARNNSFQVILEEEKVETPSKLSDSILKDISKELKMNIQNNFEVDHFEIIPISSSVHFHKHDASQGYNDFFKLMSVRTKVISSNRNELVGKTRPIFSEKQLGRID